MNDKDSRLLQEAYDSILNNDTSNVYVINGIETHYDPEIDEEEDNRKIWHFFRDKEGKEVADMDWSPYSHPSPDVIRFWIKLGCPSRSDIRNSGAGHGTGPIDLKDLQNYAKSKI
jgi:hypothetical protein